MGDFVNHPAQMPPKVLGSKEDLRRLRKRLVHLRRTLGELLVGVRDLVARGYFIPGGVRQRGGGQAPMFSLSHVVRPGLSWTQVSHL